MIFNYFLLIFKTLRISIENLSFIFDVFEENLIFLIFNYFFARFQNLDTGQRHETPMTRCTHAHPNIMVIWGRLGEL